MGLQVNAEVLNSSDRRADTHDASTEAARLPFLQHIASQASWGYPSKAPRNGLLKSALASLGCIAPTFRVSEICCSFTGKSWNPLAIGSLPIAASWLLPFFKVRRFLPWLLALALSSFLTSCAQPQVRAGEETAPPKPQQERIVAAAEKRIFLDLALEFLDEYALPEQTFEGTRVGGLSALAYDRQRDRFYALCDDPSASSPARFYTLRLALNSNNPGGIKIQNVQIEDVTELTGEDGQTYPTDSINPEGIAYAPPNSVFVASEGVSSLGIAPFVSEFDLGTGQWQRSLPIPPRYVPDAAGAEQKQGVPNNLGFESLTLSSEGVGQPFRLFTATESPLLQDRDSSSSQPQARNRLLHYLLSDDRSMVISEHLYPLDIGPKWSLTNGLTDLLALAPGGHFLSLERSLGFLGYGARIYQLATGSATDTSGIVSLKGELKGIEPIKKKLLLDLADLGITLDNLEGMTLGPRLPDGTQSLLLVSDNDFDKERATQFLLFRFKTGR